MTVPRQQFREYIFRLGEEELGPTLFGPGKGGVQQGLYLQTHIPALRAYLWASQSIHV